MNWRNFRIEEILDWLEKSFPSLTSNNSLRTLILVSFAIVLLSLAIMGYFAYDGVQDLNASLQEAAKPLEYVETLRKAMNAQEKADNMVFRYLIREDEDRLMGTYFDHIRIIEAALTELDSLPAPMAYDVERIAQMKVNFGKKMWNHFRLVSLLGDAFLIEEFKEEATKLTPFRGYDFPERPGDTTLAMGILLAEDASYSNNLRSRLEQMENSYLENRQARAAEAEDLNTSTLRFTALFTLFVLTISTILLSIIFNDLNRNRELQDRLRSEKKRAEKLTRVKEEFLANMSHEIRTPMNALMGFAGQLSETPLSEKQHKLLQPIQNSAKYLLALLNDVLDYSKMESQQFSLEEIGFSPSKVLQDVKATFERVAAKKGISLLFELDSKTPEVLIGDPVRLKQMLFNLVSNALKFTEQGTVGVKLVMGNIRGERIWMDFLIEDTGIGIPQDKLSEIFSEFSQADNSISRRYGGTGLGLSITKKLALMHGGNIQLKSKEGKGTQAILHLNYKLGKAHELEVEESKQEINPQLLAGHNILAADDEPYNRLLIKSILEKWGVAIDLVENGTKLLEALEKKRYSLILMDLQMPEKDGIASTRYIRETLKLDLPIIALTAASTPDEIKRALGAGMQAHLVKPFEEKELFSLMCDLLAVPPSENPPISPPTSQPDKPNSSMKDPNQPFDLDNLARLSQQNGAFMNNMLRIFVNSTSENLDAIDTAHQEKDWNTISQRAHKIIPPCRHLGMNRMVARLKEVEEELKKPEPSAKVLAQIDPIKQELRKVVKLVEQEIAED